MGFETFILSEVIQTQKYRNGIYLLRSEYFFSHIVQNNHAKIHRAKEAKKIRAQGKMLESHSEGKIK